MISSKILLDFNHAEMKRVRQKMQIIFQDPFSSLDPRMTVHDIIAEPLRINRIGTRAQQSDRVLMNCWKWLD